MTDKIFLETFEVITGAVAKGGRDTFLRKEAGGLLSRIREAEGNFQKTLKEAFFQ